jgi:hypothetical protein
VRPAQGRRVVVVGRDLMTATRIASAAEAAGYQAARVDEPLRLPKPADVDIAFVDWDDRQPGWADTLLGWRAGSAPAPRLLLFGSHRDVAGHREARTSGLGPMMARSKLFASLPALLDE